MGIESSHIIPISGHVVVDIAYRQLIGAYVLDPASHTAYLLGEAAWKNQVQI